ncbi:NUDIX domain-containing protein [Pediococcus siamensis]|uniref:NUDIX domain-containing protein n=1 Tax=Pediococcus siamensis TaxID=381829 RepID=UPI0039A11AEA
MNDDSYDLHFQQDGQTFNFRAAGVLQDQAHYLVCESGDPRADLVFVGGKVKFGETSQQAIQREFFEECHIHVTIDRLLWVIENQLSAAPTFQQIMLVYLLQTTDSVPQFTNKHRKLVWRTFSELQQANFKPAVFKDVTEFPQTPQTWQNITDKSK